jgi:hypothetical protein
LAGPEFDSFGCDFSQCDFSGYQVSGFEEPTRGAQPWLYGDVHAVSALGLLGSVESLTPALAPIAGLWLLEVFGWNASFNVIAILAFVLAVVMWFARSRLPTVVIGLVSIAAPATILSLSAVLTLAVASRAVAECHARKTESN